MAVNVRRSSYRTSNPFSEKIRARIFGASYTSSSSGSEHDAEPDVVSSSPPPCLSYLVQSFIEDDPPTTTTTQTPTESTHDFGSDSDSNEFTRPDPTALIHTVINPIVRSNADPFRNQLLAQIVRAVGIFSIFKKDKSIFNRNLMAYLREIGYNAGVCKTRWDSCGGLPAGNYQFIDVISPESGRYLVDAEFSGEFVIARETESYCMLRNSLPRVFVGKSDDLKRIVRLMCDEARRSMKINGLTLAPWRKNRYMQGKWLGSFRRTTNHLPVISSPVVPNFAVKCRSVGFELPGESGRLVGPPATGFR